MKYAVIFLVLASMCAYAMLSSETVAARILWGGCSFASCWIAVAYGCNRANWLLKTSRGHHPWWAWAMLWPYFGMVWLTFWLYKWINPRPPSTEIVPGVWLSRRLTAREAQASGVSWTSILDLAAEFHRTPRRDVAYLSMPVLDTMAPTPEQLRQGAIWLQQQRSRGPVLIHCALGHGRSASVVMGWLVFSGIANGVDEAISMVRRLRPGVGLNPHQRTRLHQVFPGRGPSYHPDPAEAAGPGSKSGEDRL